MLLLAPISLLALRCGWLHVWCHIFVWYTYIWFTWFTPGVRWEFA